MFADGSLLPTVSCKRKNKKTISSARSTERLPSLQCLGKEENKKQSLPRKKKQSLPLTETKWRIARRTLWQLCQLPRVHPGIPDWRSPLYRSLKEVAHSQSLHHFGNTLEYENLVRFKIFKSSWKQKMRTPKELKY